MPRHYDASLTNDFIIRHANARNGYERAAYSNVLSYLDLIETTSLNHNPVGYTVEILKQKIEQARSDIRYFERFSDQAWAKRQIKKHQAIVEAYSYAIPRIQASLND